ncbi:hypothetical protein EVAR_4896_1 [Eumeta japonica]|uniref:Uncharacterized protein n=1 Tax=Eumeta variegata TaxID=151549 RepID=A0A4C1Y176_EUMVA|nr:hypothetical protein EVAR_4896_1 [Eumeta japonica]
MAGRRQRYRNRKWDGKHNRELGPGLKLKTRTRSRRDRAFNNPLSSPSAHSFSIRYPILTQEVGNALVTPR